MIADTPEPPYFAVIFTSLRTEGDHGYDAMAEAMERLARQQPGFLGFEAAREDLGIAISYWKDEASIAAWKADVRHLAAQEKGRTAWYTHYKTRVARVERVYGFDAPG
jgi:heme-degrading monooxygenase HmoA